MAEEEVVAAAGPVDLDHKRKLEDLELDTPELAVSDPLPAETLGDSNTKLNTDSNSISDEDQSDVQEPQEIAQHLSNFPEAKRPRLEDESDGSAADNGPQAQPLDDPLAENAQHPSLGTLQMENGQHTSVDNLQMGSHKNPSIENHQTGNATPSSDEYLQVDAQQDSGGDLQQPPTGIPLQEDLSSTQQKPTTETQIMSRKMEVPNKKVGVLIGKAGDTIRFLQLNSGTEIQITKDTDVDPNSATRPVELIGTQENINKAEKLIKDVIAEADAGGSPALVTRGFGTAQAVGAAEQIQIQVPNEKVGLIIGKGGGTIKNLQTKSGARIQLIPQHLPEGDQLKERIVRVTGNKKQIEMAREMIKEVMNQPARPSPLSGVYNQQTYRPHGPTGPPQWGPRGLHPAQPMGYDYQQRGVYPSRNPQFPPPTYGSYLPQQLAPRSSLNTGWDRRPSASVQAPQSGGYDYYGQGGGHMADASIPAPVSAVPTSLSAVGHPTQANHNYGQPATHSQSMPPQQNHGHGFVDPKYENQPPTQHAYGGHNASQGVYPQQVSTQFGYAQQAYSKPPSCGMPSRGPPQMYVTNQPGDAPYQGPMSATQSYGQSVPSQQSYPNPSSGSAQQMYPYGSTPATNDMYNQPPSVTVSGPGYLQQGSQAVSGYGQPGVQPATGYAQGGPVGGFGPYSSSQSGYNEQPANMNYGYQGPSDTGYSNAPGSVFGAPTGQYVRPTPNQPNYQSVPQSGSYGGVPGNVPVGYGNNLLPQPGYGQYDSTQIYGAHH